MATNRQNLLRQFVERPPRLEGGISLALDPINESRARIHVGTADHEYHALAGSLSVPYASGLQRLLASDPLVEVALVEHAARGLDRAAQEQGVGYLDLRGRGRLIGPGFVYVAPPLTPSYPSTGGDVEGDGQDESDRRAPINGKVSPFAPKASRVVRAFLSEPSRRWRLSELAWACDMNPGNVHRVLAALVAHDLVERDRDEYLVADPGSLLEAWSEQGRRVRAKERMTVDVSGSLPQAVRHVLTVLGNGAVVSGELAAELYAPHLPAKSAIIHRLDARPLDLSELSLGSPVRAMRSAGHIVIDQADEGVASFKQERDGLPLVSPPQLYFDLFRERGRAREAAEHVRREVISF